MNIHAALQDDIAQYVSSMTKAERAGLRKKFSLAGEEIKVLLDTMWSDITVIEQRVYGPLDADNLQRIKRCHSLIESAQSVFELEFLPQLEKVTRTPIRTDGEYVGALLRQSLSSMIECIDEIITESGRMGFDPNMDRNFRYVVHQMEITSGAFKFKQRIFDKSLYSIGENENTSLMRLLSFILKCQYRDENNKGEIRPEYLSDDKTENINDALAAVFKRADDVMNASKGGRPSEGYQPRIESRIRLEPENVDWLKSKGPNHLSRINGILTALREAEQGETPETNIS